jgi:hypothetical protein
MRTGKDKIGVFAALGVVCLATFVSRALPVANQGRANESITHPVVSEDTSPP